MTSNIFRSGTAPFIFTLFATMCSTKGTVPEYEAVSGGLASLPCDIIIPRQPDVISLILWYRDADRAPIYTLDFRRGPPEKAKHFPSKSLEERSYFDISIQPPMLKVDPVYVDDQGVYRCSIEYRRSRTVTRTVKLNILIPPREVVILDDRGQKLKGVAGPYDEGAYLSLICEVEGGNPLPSVSWWRGRKMLNDNFYRTPQGFVRNELVILELRRSDLMAEFTCMASNTNLTAPVASSVKIDLNLKPVYVKITTPQRPLNVGEDLRLDCETSGSRPPAGITWWMEGRKIQSGKESIPASRNLTYSSLSIKPTVEDNGKIITCRAENAALPNSDIDDFWFLNVLYPPEVSLVLGANIKLSKIKEGNDVYLECVIRANPLVTELTWLFEGGPLYTNASIGVIISNQSLVLQRVRKEHRGRYRCIAVNSEGRGKSHELLLEVRYAPTCKPSQKTVYGVARGEAVNISCEVEADPGDVTFRWALNNSVDNLELQSFSSNGPYSTVTFTPRTMLEYGAVLCWGRNAVGEQKEPCVVRVIPAGPPDPVKNCLSTNQTSSWIYVECEPGYGGGLTQLFHLEVYNSAVEHLQANLTSTDAPNFSVSDMPPSTQFVLVVYATNEKGRSNSVALVGKTLSSSPESEESALVATLSPLVAILLAVLGTLLTIGVVALALVQVKKRKTHKAPEADDKVKMNDILKKTAEDLVENAAACPDVVPPNNIFGSRDSDSIEDCKRDGESPDTCKARDNYQNCVVALKRSWSLKKGKEKTEVEVTLADFNQQTPVSRLPSADAAFTGEVTLKWPEDVTEEKPKQSVLVVEVTPNGSGHKTKVSQPSTTPF